jgi:hypothetical protein
MRIDAACGELEPFRLAAPANQTESYELLPGAPSSASCPISAQ